MEENAGVVADGPVYKSTGRIWLNAARDRAVPEGSDGAASLLCGPGQLVLPADVARLDITIHGPKANLQEIPNSIVEKHGGVTITRLPRKKVRT